MAALEVLTTSGLGSLTTHSSNWSKLALSDRDGETTFYQSDAQF